MPGPDPHDERTVLPERPPERGHGPRSWEHAAGQEVDGYRLVRRLDLDANNQFGEVWLAERSHPFVRVAIKFIRPDRAREELIRRFSSRESSALAALKHPFIAQFRDFRVEGGVPHLVMEYVEGAQVCRYCDDHGLGIDDRLRLMAKVCQAVQHVHAANVIHRDLKPGNILVDTAAARHGEDPVPKLIDFGLARIEGESTDAAGAVHSVRGFIGTPAYAAPEQHRMLPTEAIGREADIYALGAVLFELVAGVTPVEHLREARPARRSDEEHARFVDAELRFGGRPRLLEAFDRLDGATQESIARRRGTSRSEMRRRLASRLAHLADRALRVDPKSRFSSAKAMGADIEAFLGDRDFAEAAAESRKDRFLRSMRRNRLQWTAAAAVFVALCAGLAATSWQWQRSREQAIRAERSMNFLLDDILKDREDDGSVAQLRVSDIVRNSRAGLRKIAKSDPDAALNVAVRYARILVASGDFGGLPDMASMAREFAGAASDAVSDRAMQELLLLEEEAGARRDRPDSEPAMADLRARIAAADAMAGDASRAQAAQLRNQLAMLLKRDPTPARLDEAEQLYRWVLQERRRANGEDHLDTLIARHNLNIVAVLRARGEPAEARAAAMAEVLADRERICADSDRVLQGDERWQVLASDAERLGALTESGRASDAVREYPGLISRLRSTFGPVHWRTMETRARYGRALMWAGQTRAAAQE
ncbi:MAG: protein kinase domain-containing protein, partial [Phycisphaerales bacterium]